MAVDPDKQAELLRKLEALRLGFLEQLPVRLAGIAAEWDAFLETEDRQHLTTLHRLVHSLTGTAGTFGLQELSTCSREVERYLKGLAGGERNLDETALRETDAYLGRLFRIPVSPASTSSTMVTPPVSSRPTTASRLSTVLLYSGDPALVSSLSSQLTHFDYRVQVIEDFNALAQADAVESAVALVIDAEAAGREMDESRLAGLRTGMSSALPLLVIDRNGGFHERLRAVRSGGEAFLVKPFGVTELVDHLDRLTGSTGEEPFRILVMEDDPDLARHYEVLLEGHGMRVRTLTEPTLMSQALVDLRPDLVLMDLYMPECNGAELAQVIRQQSSYLSLPIVFLSSEHDLDKQFAAMSLGGDDFLTKPINDQHLVRAVRNRAARSRMLHSLIFRDSLTGLLTHSRIKEALEVELSRARRSGSPLAFAMLDIDHFKRVNDQYGHMAGDHVIKSLSHLLRQRLRKSDIIGRYGGEEFAVIMPDTSVHEARRVLDELRAAFALIQHHWHDQEIRSSLSGGIAGSADFGDGEMLTVAADEALYRAKEHGRDRIEIGVPVDGDNRGENDGTT